MEWPPAARWPTACHLSHVSCSRERPCRAGGWQGVSACTDCLGDSFTVLCLPGTTHIILTAPLSSAFGAPGLEMRKLGNQRWGTSPRSHCFQVAKLRWELGNLPQSLCSKHWTAPASSLGTVFTLLLGEKMAVPRAEASPGKARIVITLSFDSVLDT